jgi:calcium-dependent protein kinase
MYIATQASEREVTRLRQIFISLDKDGDGRLSMGEMREAFKLHKGIANLTDLMEAIDTDQSGFIDYSGTSGLSLRRVLGRHARQGVLPQRGQAGHRLCRV